MTPNNYTKTVKAGTKIRSIAFMVAASFFLAATALAVSGIDIGSTKAEVTARMGAPKSYLKMGSRETLDYEQAAIDLVDGVVTEIKNKQAVAAPPTQSPPQPVTPAASSTANKASDAIEDYRLSGKAIDLNKIMKKGAVTVVVFYADW